MDPDTFLREVRRFATPSAVIPSRDEDGLFFVAESLLRQLRRKQEQLVKEYPESPALMCYMSDGCGAFVTTRHTRASVAGKIVRNAKFRHEFLMQLAIMKVQTPAGETKAAILVDGAVSLKHGKLSWQCFQAGMDFLPLLRQQGHMGIIVNFYCFDGLMQKPLTRMFEARHKMYYSEWGEMGGEDNLLQSLTDLVLAIKCGAHSCSNALKNGLREFCDPNTLENVHIIIAALRNSADALHSHIMGFIVQCVGFSETRSGEPADIQAFWLSLGVEADILEEFVLLDPVWRDDKLWVAAWVEQDASGMERVAALLAYALRWAPFTETRWAGLGRSSRMYLLSLMIGVEGLIGICRDDEHCSKFHLNGYNESRAALPSKQYLIVGAYASYPAEAMNLELSEDDRLLRRRSEFEGLLVEELQYLSSLPEYVWARLSSAIGGARSAGELRVAALRCAVTAMGYINRECFQPLERYPLLLTQGNVDARLSELVQADPQDATATKVKTLLSVGFPRAQLKSALELARDAACTTTLVEQAHGGGAVMLRSLPEYGARTLRVRQAVHQCLKFLTTAPEEMKLERLRNKLSELEGASIGHVTARQVFFKTMSNVAARGHFGQGRVAANRALMKKHGKDFAALPARCKRELAELAARMRDVKEKDLQEEIGELRELILGVERRQAQDLKEIGLKNHMGSFKMSDRDINHMCLDYDALAIEEQAIFLKFEKEDTVVAQGPCPWWVRLVAINRDRFVACGFSDSDSLSTVFMLLYAIQSPYGAHFLQLRRRPDEIPSMQAAFAAGDENLNYSRLRFDYSFICKNEAEVGIDDTGEIWVIPNMCMGDGIVFSDCRPVLWEDFTKFHPKTAPQRRSATRAATKLHVPSELRDQLLQEHPWLTEDDFGALLKKKIGVKGRRGRNKRKDIDDHSESEDSSSDEGEVAEKGDKKVIEVDVAEALASFRAAHDPCKAGQVFFHTRILGGPWTASNRGVVADGIGGYARGGLPTQWCAEYGWPKQHANYYRKYGIEGATHLASEYVRRPNFYFGLWVDSDDEHFRYQDYHFDGYQEDLSFVEWLSSQPVASASFARGSDLRNLRPVNPP